MGASALSFDDAAAASKRPAGSVKLTGAVTVKVDIYTNFGRDNEDRKSITVQLKDAKEMITIGQIEF